jgi:tetraacyldisaccharide 4'-kinase
MAMPPTLRAALAPLGWLYGRAAALRNRAFERGYLEAARLPVPVISVGNLSVGGTGKTPLVAWLVGQARLAGKRPGVLARGYRRARHATLNDEGMMLAARFPDLPQEQNKDRVAGARALLGAGVDLIILDDGFQHRRLARDVDLVCVHALQPLDACLPAGRLRERPAGLHRAHAVILTHADRLAAGARAERVAELRRLAGRDLPVFAAAHTPADLVHMPSGVVQPTAALKGRDVCLLSAIGSPAEFERNVRDLGARVVEHRVERDHHHHQAQEVAGLARRAAARNAVLVVTEKDAAKLTGVPAEYYVLRIDLRFLGEAPSATFLRLA